MPNLDNILSPFTIIGNACPATSLVARAVSSHSHCTIVGGTTDLVHSVWKSIELFPSKKPLGIPDAIRHHFLRLFPSPSKHWLQMPTGVPIARSVFDSEEAFLDWYWEVLERVFPKATYFTVLRHPLDVAVSSCQSVGMIETIVDGNRLAAKTITHPRSRVIYAVNYHDLVQDLRSTIEQLLTYLSLELEDECLEPLNSLTDTNKCSSLRKQWERIPRSLITPEYCQAVDACWAKFGCDFGGWPF